MAPAGAINSTPGELAPRKTIGAITKTKRNATHMATMEIVAKTSSPSPAYALAACQRTNVKPRQKG
jgi:hypothetical protein